MAKAKKGESGYVAPDKWTNEQLAAAGTKGAIINAIRGALRAGNDSVDKGKNFDFGGLFKGKGSEQGWAYNATKKKTGYIFDASNEDISALASDGKSADKDLADKKYTQNVHSFLKLAKSKLVGKGGGGGARKYTSMF